MLQVRNLYKSYGSESVLAGAGFILNDGEHVGLIGPNGSGKTTLLRCITGREQPDSGVINLSPRDAVIGYLSQSFEDNADLTVGEVVARARIDLADAERALQQSADALTAADDMEAALEAYNKSLARFEALGGYEREHIAASVLQGLELGEVDLHSPVHSLSGGQKSRLGLATLLLAEPDILLLDEPTNHLDIEALSWLESFVQRYRNSILIVSHDREFLDRTVTRIVYLDPDKHVLTSYPGNYSDFARARQHEAEIHREVWTRQQEYVAQVELDIARLKGEARATELSTTPRQPGIRKLARKKARVGKSRERKLERYMESDERVEKPKQEWWLKLDFGPAPQGGRAVLRVEDASAGYPGREPLLEHISLEVDYGEKIALVGPNGAGKTTLLRLIEGSLKPLSGTLRVGAGVRMGMLSQEQETLQPDWTVLQAVLQEKPMSETEARGFLHFFLFSGDEVFRRISQCSLGERSRLQLALLVVRGCNFLLLDEPLNHLDIGGREHFEAALEAFEGTVIAVAHDRAFLSAYPDRIVEVKQGRVRVFEGAYDDYKLQATS